MMGKNGEGSGRDTSLQHTSVTQHLARSSLGRIERHMFKKASEDFLEQTRACPSHKGY